MPSGIQLRPGVLRYRTVVGDLDVSILLLKAPDVARLLRRNLLELGVAGDEWLLETGAPPAHRCFETRSYAASVCLLTAENDPRPPGRIHSVATPYPNLARQLLCGTVPDADIITVSGSTEALVPDIADACIDLVETGTSAMLNSLAVRRCFVNVTTHSGPVCGMRSRDGGSDRRVARGRTGGGPMTLRIPGCLDPARPAVRRRRHTRRPGRRRPDRRRDAPCPGMPAALARLPELSPLRRPGDGHHRRRYR